MIVGMAVPTTVRSSAATAIAVMIPTVRIICVRVSGGMGSPAGGWAASAEPALRGRRAASTEAADGRVSAEVAGEAGWPGCEG